MDAQAWDNWLDMVSEATMLNIEEAHENTEDEETRKLKVKVAVSVAIRASLKKYVGDTQ